MRLRGAVEFDQAASTDARSGKLEGPHQELRSFVARNDSLLGRWRRLIARADQMHVKVGMDLKEPLRERAALEGRQALRRPGEQGHVNHVLG